MKIKISIEKKYLFFLSMFIFLLVGSSYVASVYTSYGHDLGEMDLSNYVVASDLSGYVEDLSDLVTQDELDDLADDMYVYTAPFVTQGEFNAALATFKSGFDCTRCWRVGSTVYEYEGCYFDTSSGTYYNAYGSTYNRLTTKGDEWQFTSCDVTKPGVDGYLHPPWPQEPFHPYSEDMTGRYCFGWDTSYISAYACTVG